MARKKELKPTGTAINCPHCQKPSGWTKEEIVKISGHHDLKCQNEGCKRVAIRMRPTSFTLNPMKVETARGNKPPSNVTPFNNRGKTTDAEKEDSLILEELTA